MVGSPNSSTPIRQTPTRPPRRVITGEGSRPRPRRTKTGCLTCRKRKKKCDERKPICGNCHRANFVCRPNPGPRPYPPGNEHASVIAVPEQPRTGDNSTRVDAVEDISSGPTSSMATLSFADSNASSILALTTNSISQSSTSMIPPPMQDFNVMQSYLTTPPNQISIPDYMSNMNFDDGIETLTTPLGRLPPLQHPTDLGSGYFVGGLDYWNQSFAPTSMMPLDSPSFQQPVQIVPPSPLQTTLAFPIPGVDTRIRQRMFYHFYTTMASILTTSNGESNPMRDVIIPLALEDPVIMDTLLGLSGSHILKLDSSSNDVMLQAEKQRLHAQALHMQAYRTRNLLAADPSPSPSDSPRNRERIFATSLLLCLHEICEGNSDSTSQKHLDTARQIIASATPNHQNGYPHNVESPAATTFHPFLVEFFLYHMCLALVTMPSFLSSQASINNLTSLLGQDKSMVGVIEMLLDFIQRIALLRQQAQLEGSRSSVILNSIDIYSDLDRWTPQVPLSPDQQTLADFYQKALSIWLFSIVNPELRAHHQIQGLVQEVTSKMSGIPDSVKACLLFPLFMVGGAAITDEDRGVVSRLFRELSSWSALGNVDVTFAVVRNMWRDCDEGVPKAWDWTAQLEKKSMRLLVT